MKTASVKTQNISLKEKLFADLTTLGYGILPAKTDGADVILTDYQGLSELIEGGSADVAIVLLYDGSIDKDEGFLLKAHEILLIPYTINELELRLKLALIKQGNYIQELKRHGNTLAVDGMTIDFDNYEVIVDGTPLDLTFKEYELLKCLISHRGRVYTRDQLLSNVWGYDYYGGARTVDVHIRRLRAKLGRYESYIETIRNVGYRFKK